MATDNQKLKMLTYLNLSMQESNGQSAFMPSEIRLNADLAGLSELVRLFQTDCALLQREMSMSSYLQKIWLSVTRLTTDVKEESFTSLGNILKRQVLQQTSAFLTPQELERSTPAQLNAQMAANSRSSNVKLTQLLKPQTNNKSNSKSTNKDQWRLASKSIKISSATRVVSITMLLVNLLVAMLLRWSVGELKMALTIGFALTLGALLGVKVDSSELKLETVASMNQFGLALQKSMK